MAGDAVYQRGRWYLSDGAVSGIAEDGGVVSAHVQGTLLYRVVLQVERNQLAWTCSCPMGQSGYFCKHCVAAGLAWIETSARLRRNPGPIAIVAPADLRAHLRGLGSAGLADIIMAHAGRDREFGRKLAVAAAVARSGGPDKARLQTALAEATRYEGLQHWELNHDLTRRVREVLEPVRLLVGGEHNALALELTGYTLERLALAAAAHPLSTHAVRELAEEVRKLHLQAWRKARPEPVESGRRLFAMMTAVPPAILPEMLSEYPAVLDTDGLIEFRRLAHEAWARVPVLEPGRKLQPGDRAELKRYGSVMQALARLTGRPEDAALAMERDLSTSWRLSEVAALYAAAGKHGKAIELAELGCRLYPDVLPLHLRDLLINEYLRVGRMTDAMNLAWAEFAERPGPWSFSRLRSRASALREWPTWRNEAIELMRARAAQKGDEGTGAADGLIFVLLDEGDVEAAWRFAASLSPGPETCLRLASARAKTHPQQAALMYQQLAERLLAGRQDRGPKEAAHCLLKAARLFRRAGFEDDFRKHLEELRLKHKSRRRFVALLDAATWPWQRARSSRQRAASGAASPRNRQS